VFLLKKLLLVSIVLTVIMATVLAAPVKVEFWHAMGSQQGEAVEEIVKMFNDQNPDIEVEPVYIGNYGALNQKLLASVQSDTLPVISQSYSNWTSKLLQSDVVADLTGFINGEEGFTDAQWEDIWKPFREMCTWGDEVYALPFNKSIYVTYYDSDLFDMEGIEPPEDYDDVRRLAEELTVVGEDGEVERYGFGFRTTVDAFSIFLLNNGGTIVEQNADGSYEITLDSPETRKTLEFLKGMKDDNIAYVEGGYLNGPFGEGRIAFYCDTIAGKSYVDSACRGKHDWNWSAIPSNETFRPPFAGTDVIMFETADQAQKEAGWKFMKFLTSQKVTTFWSMKTGYLPVRKSALETPEWKTFTRLEPKAAIPVQFVPDAYVDPKPATWYEIRNVVGDMFNNIIYEKWTVDEGIDWAVKEIHGYLNQ